MKSLRRSFRRGKATRPTKDTKNGKLSKIAKKSEEKLKTKTKQVRKV
jgi:hypothetical protein